MGFTLRSGISFCDVSGRLLFLDVMADRYFCLGPEAEKAFRIAMRDRYTAPPGAGPLKRLIEARMLIATADESVPMPCQAPAAATGSLLDCIDVPATMRLRLGVLRDIAAARFDLKYRNLQQVLAAVAKQKCRPGPCPGETGRTASQIAAAFQWSGNLMRSHDQCLPRSVAAARRLASMGVAADLIIGVRLNPFAAHSWVQCGQWLVNDRADNVRPFTPVLIL